VTLELQPVSQREAFAFIKRHHRHHDPPRGCFTALAVNDGRHVVGVAIIGRPVARGQQDGWTAEVTRVCTIQDAPMGAASKLYSAAKRAAQALGYRRVISYILATEDGTSLRAAGWKPRYLTSGDTWNRPARPRVDHHPLGSKQLWEAA
jgi:L-amino acid N-acyltransferase YncA